KKSNDFVDLHVLKLVNSCVCDYLDLQPCREALASHVFKPTFFKYVVFLFSSFKSIFCEKSTRFRSAEHTRFRRM
ncbi:MAG: hypothetical protein ACK5XN_01120, partial [Bacteroidota bacterium]